MLQIVAQLAAAAQKHATNAVDAASASGSSEASSSCEGSGTSVRGFIVPSDCATGEAAARLQRIGSAFLTALPAAKDAARPPDEQRVTIGHPRKVLGGLYSNASP